MKRMGILHLLLEESEGLTPLFFFFFESTFMTLHIAYLHDTYHSDNQLHPYELGIEFSNFNNLNPNN